MTFLKKWAMAIALFITLLVDGSLSATIHPLLSHGTFKSSCWLLAIAVIMIGLIDDTNINEIWLALAMGIIADMYYVGFFGIYTVGLPVLCWISQKIARYLPELFWVRLIVTIILYILLNIYVWLIMNTVNVITISSARLFISLLANAVWCILFTIITYPIWYWMVQKYPFLVNLDVYR